MLSPTKSCRSSTSARQQAASYFDRLFGSRRGIVCFVVAPSGEYTRRGTYNHGDNWIERQYSWPECRELLIDRAVRCRKSSDVYVRVTLRRNPNPAKVGSSLGSDYCWADVDYIDDDVMGRLSRISSEGSFLVHSGRPGHLHVYLKMDRVYGGDVIDQANQELALYLGADSKWRENTALRVPGTLNHKGRAAGTESCPVTLEMPVEAPCAPWKPEELIAVMRDVGPRSGSRAPRQRKPRPPQTPRKAISPVEPAPLPDDLPQEILDLLGGWEKTKGRQDRSAHLHRLIALLVRKGYSDGEVMAVALLDEQAQDKWEDEDDLRREIQRSIDVLRLGDEIDEGIRRIRQEFRRNYRSTRTLATDTKLVDALLKIAERTHKLEFDVSIRGLAESASVSTGTVQTALGRLVHAGFVVRCRQKGSCNQPKSRQASRYRLQVPEDIVDTHIHRGGGGNDHIETECVSTLPILDPAHDAWRHRGLACCRPTFEALMSGVTDPGDLATDTGRTTRTIKRHLSKLSIYGLTERKQNGAWVAFERPLDDVAKEVGTNGIGERQAERHRFERDVHKQHLQHVRDLERETEDELIEAGFVWGVGRYEGILMRPPGRSRWAEVVGRRWRQRQHMER
jgi:hypothetical protein